jgi:hypothetical protein
VSPLKIKIPSKNVREKPTNTPIIHSVYLLCMVAPICFDIILPFQGSFHHVTRHNTLTHNILSTAPQLSISQKAQGTPSEDGNVMSKLVGATIHN